MLSTNSSSKKINIKNNNLNLTRNINNRKINQLKQSIYKNIIKKYINPEYYLKNIINNIIYNEKTHIVAIFKDYLILDDCSEFLKRYYKKIESYIRLPKFYEYYDTYSKIYPNYTSLPEGKFIYKNIQKKQRMIDLQEQMEIQNKKNINNNINDNKNEIDIFSSNVIQSILNQTNKENIEELFNINKDNFEIEEQKFYKKVNDIIDTIEKYEKVNHYIHSFSRLDNFSPLIKNTPNKSSLIKKNIIFKKDYNCLPSELKRNISNNSNSSKNYCNNNQNNNIFNYSKKINLINDDNNPKTDRTLIKKLEHNLFKLSKKNIIFSQKYSNNTQRESQRDNSSKSKNNLSTNSQKKNNTKLSSKNDKYKQLNNIKSLKNIKMPLTYRMNKMDHLIASNNIKSPLTNRYSIKQTISNHKSNDNFNSMKNKIRNLNNNSGVKKVINNIIYIVNQNPFPTNIHFYNNNINQLVSNNDLNLNRPHSSRTSFSKNSIDNNNKTKKKNKINYQYEINKNKIQKRNQSSVINSGNNNLLKTLRDIQFKEIHVLKNSLKSLDKKDGNSTSNNIFSKNENIFNLKQNCVSRNKKVENYVKNINSANKENNNDSLSKIGFLDVVNIKKSKIKGIQIKNFSKVFNINLSQSK